MKPVCGQVCGQNAPGGLPGPGCITGKDVARLEHLQPLKGLAQRLQLLLAPVVQGAVPVGQAFIGPAGFGVADKKQVLHGARPDCALGQRSVWHSCKSFT